MSEREKVRETTTAEEKIRIQDHDCVVLLYQAFTREDLIYVGGARMVSDIARRNRKKIHKEGKATFKACDPEWRL